MIVFGPISIFGLPIIYIKINHLGFGKVGFKIQAFKELCRGVDFSKTSVFKLFIKLEIILIVLESID